MSIRVRFAPSPTGLLHIGGFRTALYCYLISKAKEGRFVLRIEDTDEERSHKKYEEALVEDLAWAGLEWDEGPGKEGPFAPYRQSERSPLYTSLAQQLVAEGKAYPCFLKMKEWEELSEKARAQKLPPHAFHGQYRDLDPQKACERIKKGEEHVIRFKNLGKKYTFKDLVRGEVSFPEDMVGDFVIIRSNGRPVYNFCCVVDDWKMKISHVIRAEEHLNNTVRQLMLYEAFGVPSPTFAHCSLLVGEDRQKLSKRHAATSVRQYREEGYLPEALANYLCLLGWGHPQERDIFDLKEVIPLFDLKRLVKAPALYDQEKLKFFNAQHLRNLSSQNLFEHCQKFIPPQHSFHSCDEDWQKRALKTFVEKVSLPSELAQYLNLLFNESGWGGDGAEAEEVEDILSWESTVRIKEYIKAKLEELDKKGCSYPSGEDFSLWALEVKKKLNIKGKALFKGMRAVLTHHSAGPDLKGIIPLTKVKVLLQRLD